MALINYKVNMLTYFENYEITDRDMEANVPSQDNNPAGPAINVPTWANFATNSNNTKLLKQ